MDINKNTATNQISNGNLNAENQAKSTNNSINFQTIKELNDRANSELEEMEAKQVSNNEITDLLLQKIERIDFKKKAFPEIEEITNEISELEARYMDSDGKYIPENLSDNEKEKFKELHKKLDSFKIKQKHYLIISIEEILKLATENNWGLCKNQSFVYLFNGNYWNLLSKETLEMFLGKAAEKMGVPKFDSKHYEFRDKLLRQFLSTAFLPIPEKGKDTVLINLPNGTFEISPKGQILRAKDRNDFLTYQLNFKYNPQASAPLFQTFLNRVLPEKEKQLVLAEYLGYIFISTNVLKLEKVLILFGQGANGKSVIYEILNALLGSENFSSYSLQSLTDKTGYFRAKIANKLVNYASEINGTLETDIFKQLASGEPVEARLPYGEPFLLNQYAKLIFNCNELPKDVEHTNAYFRRFLIIPFDVTIPENEQDKELPKKIIQNELSGIFNWILTGLNRLLAQKKFTPCESINNQIENYKKHSDSVLTFIEENGYTVNSTKTVLMKDLYFEYKTYCIEDGYRPVNKANFSKRLKNNNIVIGKDMYGNFAYLSKL